MQPLSRRTSLAALGTSVLVISLAAGIGRLSMTAIEWSSVRYGQGTQSWQLQNAASCTEGGYTDWRLPTPEEFTAAVESQTVLFPPGNASYWTSRRQGSAYGYVAKFEVGADGLPVPSTVQILRYRSNAILYAYYVRP